MRRGQKDSDNPMQIVKVEPLAETNVVLPRRAGKRANIILIGLTWAYSVRLGR